MKALRAFALLFLIVSVLLPVSCTPSTSTSSTPAVTVHFIDVGQGDSILIDCGETEVLIDGGKSSPGVVDYLNAYVDGPLDVMVATHTDADHIGGLIAVLENYQVGDIWINGFVATSKTYKDFMALVNAEGAAVHEAVLGNVIRAGTLEFKVLNPPDTLFSDANNNSIVIVFSYGDVDFIFTGDAEKEAEEAMLLQGVFPVPDVEVLKVGHHASRSASSVEFLDVVKPEIAVYMCALDNDYDHPHPETITALNAIGVVIYGTENYGTIKITTDGKTYSVQTEKTPE